MATTRPPFESREMTEAMLEGLTAHIRAALKERIMERIAPDIEAALDAGMASFKIAVYAMHEPHNMSTVIKVLLEDRRDAKQKRETT